jgi:hypothetical protein
LFDGHLWLDWNGNCFHSFVCFIFGVVNHNKRIRPLPGRKPAAKGLVCGSDDYQQRWHPGAHLPTRGVKKG